MIFVKYLLAVVIGFCGGTYFGFYRAPTEFLYKTGQFNASILVSELKLLKAGKIEDVISMKEFYLNDELANHGYHLESKLSWLLPYNYYIDDSHIQRAVDYRVSNLYTGEPDMSSPKSWQPGVDMKSQLVRDVIDAQKEKERLIAKVLKLYKSK